MKWFLVLLVLFCGTTVADPNDVELLLDPDTWWVYGYATTLTFCPVDGNDVVIDYGGNEVKGANEEGAKLFFEHFLKPYIDKYIKSKRQEIIDEYIETQKPAKPFEYTGTSGIPLCPYCQIPTQRTAGASLVTLLYFAPIYNEHGVNTNPDRNTVTTSWYCDKCGCSYSTSGNAYDGYDYLGA